MKKIFFDRGCKDLSDEEKDSMNFKYCDVTNEDDRQNNYSIILIMLMVYYIQWHMQNAKTCLGERYLYTKQKIF